MKGNVKRILSFCLAAVIAVTTVGYAPPSFTLTEMTTKSRMEEAEIPGDKATPSEAENPGDKATPSETVKFVQVEPEEIPEYYYQVKKAGKKFWKFEDRYGEMQYRDYGYVEGEAEFPLWYEVDDKSEIELSISVDLVDEYYNLAPYVYDSISPTKSNWSALSCRILLENESIFLYDRQEVNGFTNWDFSTYSIWSVNGILKKDLEDRDLNEELGYFFYGSIRNVRDSAEQWYYADNDGYISDMSPTIDPKVSLFAANQVEVIYNLCTSDDPTNGPDNIKYIDWVDVSDGDEYYTLKDYTLEGQRLLGYMRGTSYYDLDISNTTRGNKKIRFSPQNYNYPYHVDYNIFYPTGTKIKKKDLTAQVFYAIWVPDNYDVLVALYEEDLNFPYAGINSDKYLRFVNDRFMERPYGYPIKGPFGYWRMKRIMVKKKGVSYNLDLIPRNGITLEGTTYWKYSPLEHGNNFNATFDGWVTEDGEKLSTWVPDGSGKVTYIFPKWNLQNHLVTFKGIDGVIETQQVPFGSSATEPKNITTPNGFKFIGWDIDFSDIRKDIVVNAKYEEKKTVSVTYKDWDGKVLSYQELAFGENAAPPEAPHRSGYIFTDWDKPSTNIQTDTTITAQYNKVNRYELTLDANGGTIGGESKRTENVIYGESFDQILKDGRDQVSNEYYTFAGWYTSPSGGSKYDYSENRMPESDLTVYAHWTRSSSLVTFYDWEGNVIGTQVVGIGGSATLPAGPVRSGYTFVGWDTDTTSIGDHTVVKPIYKINSYVLTLDVNGGALNGKNVEEKYFVYGDSFDQSLSDGRDNATRKYHTFDGWYTKPTGGEKYAYTGNKMPAGDVTAYAHWSRNASLVTYKDWDGGVLGNQEIVIGGDVTPPADPKRQGYTFTGWDKPSTNIMDDTTIVAQYNKDNYKLILEGNGGSLDGSNAEEEYTITYGASFDQILLEGKNNVSRPGYTFDGWYSAATGGNCYSYSGNVMPSNDLKVYAQWKANSYNVHFDSDHEKWPGGVIERKYIAGTELGSLPAPNIYGWDFLGWWTGKNGTGEKATEDKVTGTQDLTYYGSWKASSYQIRYLSEVKQPTGKSIQEFPIRQTYDTALGNLPKPVETGYTFIGWFEGTEKVTSETIFSPASGTEGYTYRAGWKANEYTVHYDGNLEAVKKNPEDKLITYGEVIGELPIINAGGYIFLGWYTDPTGGTKVIEESPILGDTTYYAQWDTISKPTVPDPIKPEPENRVEEEKITVPITPIIDSTAKPTVPDTGGTFVADPDKPYDVTYTKPAGTTARDEWVGDGKDWYHIDEAGKLNYDWYLEGEKTWYKLNKELGDRFGAALTGWNYEPMDDKSYFFDPSTTKMLTGWQLIDSKWHYFTKQNESQTYYGSNPSGSNPNGWKYDETKPGKPYGSMYQDEMTPDGYRVDENGVWKNK